MAIAPVTGVVTIRVDVFARWLPQLVRATATVGDVSPEALVGPVRTKWIVMLRQALALAARDVMHKPYEDIAKELGGRDHSSIVHAYQRAVRRLRDDGEFRQLATVISAIARTIANREPQIVILPELPL